jgi:hypothetical protein
MRKRVVSFVVAVVLGLSLLVNIAAESAVAPSLAVSPNSGPPGITVTLIASGYTPGLPAAVLWDEVVQETFNTTDSSFSMPFTIPPGASIGAHTIRLCNNCGAIEFEESASALFIVTKPPVAATQTPTPRPSTRTPTPVPSTATMTATPTELPSICHDLGLSPEAVVIDFEGFTPGTTLDLQLAADYGVGFERTLVITAPSVTTHSGSQAGKSQETVEFASIETPIRMVFTRPLQALGMFIGLEEARYTSGDITAILTVRGYRAGSDVLSSLGMSSVTFPAVRTGIEHCLTFEAAEGDLITHADLEYTDAAGFSIGEPRVIDDLTVVYSETPPPLADQPPYVEITLPADDAIFIAGDVDLRANISEDRGLEDVWYTVNDGARQRLGYSFAGSDPTQYLAGITFSAADLVPYETTRLTVIARDTAGQEASAWVDILYNPPTPTPALDIIAQVFELTQAIQCLDNPECGTNTVPIYTGRPTLLRLYVRAEGTSVEVPDVGGELCNEGECIPSLNRVSVSPTDDAIRDFRGDVSRTLNFLLPQEWVRRSTEVRLQVYVNRDGRDVGECSLDNNVFRFHFVPQTGETLHVVMMTVNAHGVQSLGSGRWPAIRWTQQFYPISEVRVYRSSEEPVDASYDYTTREGWDSLLMDLWWINFWTDDPADYLRYHAMVPDTVPHTWSGMGFVPGDESAAIYLGGGGSTTGHELGHNHGLQHAPCGSVENPNNGYPNYIGRGGIAYPRASIGEWGINLYTYPFTLYDPSTTNDFMSYCNPKFISLYSYHYLSWAVGSVAQAEPCLSGASHARIVQPSREYLVGTGEISPEGFELRKGFFRVPLPEDMELPANEGDFAVELRDTDGNVLLHRAFALPLNSEFAPSDHGAFRVIVPWEDGTALVAFLHQDQLLGGVPVSVHAPSTELLEPNGGETWPAKGSVTVRWQAGDVDGDALQTAIQYSDDGGRTWRSVARDVEGGKVALEASLLPGSSQGAIRVCVSDGVNTACDVSDAPFSVEGKGPEIFLTAPIEGGVFPTGERVIFEGNATDLEDGPVVDEQAYAWSSDRDGSLGTGRLLWGLPLTAGRHQITLTVTDRDGIQASASVSIVIGAEGEAEQPVAGPPTWLAGLGIALLALLILTGAVMVIIGLRRMFGSP